MNKKKLNKILDICQDHGHYPDVFPVNVGLDFKSESQPRTYAVTNNPRKVVLHISHNNVYWFGKLVIDGVQLRLDRKNRLDISVYNRGKHEYDLFELNYVIDICRKVTREDKELYPIAFEDYNVGDNVRSWKSKEDLIKTATEVFKARFGNKWKFEIQNV